MTSVINLEPFQYIHVLDQNLNATRVVEGPAVFAKKEEERIVSGPSQMVILGPDMHVKIKNPVVRGEGEGGELLKDKWGNVKLKHGEEEIRFGPLDPFPLYPGEILQGEPAKLRTLPPDVALLLKASRDFEDHQKVKHKAGEEWLFTGPGTYYPHVAEQQIKVVKATLIKEHHALKLEAKVNFTEENGVERKAGEQWLVKQKGMYMPKVSEDVKGIVAPRQISRNKALHLKALASFDDTVAKVQRKAGEEWLVTSKQASLYTPNVNEYVVGEKDLLVLNRRQFCVVVNVVDAKTGEVRVGHRELRKGPRAFFLNPGEHLETPPMGGTGIQSVHVLTKEEALLVQAFEEYDGHQPGAKWLIRGPLAYIPPVEVKVLEKRRVIPLDQGEGIYVRDLRSGKVTSISGKPHLLQAHEELWEKQLPKEVEELVAMGTATRDMGQVQEVVSYRQDKTKVVTYRVPYNAATQVYDYKLKKSRIVFGPELIMLGPDEEFTLLSLSGGNPKKANQIKSLCLFLGPDFMLDVVVVETADHARLSLKLAYNWVFEVNRGDQKSAETIFKVGDFVGDACKAIAARVRAAVASASFDSFHKHSNEIIRKAVFGDQPAEKQRLFFKANGLVVTGIDVQSVEPIDHRTRDALQKSVQLAIEITTKSQEAKAQHDSKRLDQTAMGKLARQKISDDCVAEEKKTSLLKLQTSTAILEAVGDHTADAEAKKKSLEVQGKANVEIAKLGASAKAKKAAKDLALFKLRKQHELELKSQQVEHEIAKARREANIETEKFKAIVSSIGADTIKSIAQAGPEMQARLLEGLGLEGVLITDGTSPINLFQTGQKMVSQNN